MLSELYTGFYISDPVGNNAFSYVSRKNQKIYVPSLIKSDLSQLKRGDEIVFSEMCDGVEKNLTGLDAFILFYLNETPVFIFDNHNHAFCFWAWARLQGRIDLHNTLVHIDQHKDMRTPDALLEQEQLDDLKMVFCYTNETLNVGNFIQPAIHAGLIDRVVMIDNEAAFSENTPESYLLDIDIDIFSDDMRYIDNDLKLNRIRELMPKAKVITIATSPFFIDQERALDYVRKLFE